MLFDCMTYYPPLGPTLLLVEGEASICMMLMLYFIFTTSCSSHRNNVFMDKSSDADIMVSRDPCLE